MKTKFVSGDPWPGEKSKVCKVLRLLLSGKAMDVVNAFEDLNVVNLSATMSDLRKFGWPVRVLKVPHPTLHNEYMSRYYLDTLFRIWHQKYPREHPSLYKCGDGRGVMGDLEIKPEWED